MGPILRSTPQLVGRPDALILDESYDAFKLAYATRPLVLYTSTNDGFLHAFKVASGDPATETTPQQQVTTKTQNELWAFIPPAVLSGLQTQYPGSHQILLDGVPVIKDVVASPADVALFERSGESARFGAGLWRSVLVQGFGGTRGGYFALDITDPVISGDTGGPRFLWQLTTDSDGNPLFGEGGGTPLITTVFLNDKEVAVAVLPGGEGTRDDGAPIVKRKADLSFVDPDYTPRPKVPAYSGTAARSLTIVRLDNGEIIRTFRNDADDVDDLEEGVVIETGIDSPITGTPVAYPSEVGAIADRVFVGDQDGALWRIDLSESNPDDWTMTLFYDAFPWQTASGTMSYGAKKGQPIATRPIISVDDANQLVVLFSTGDQESMFASEGTDNFLVSLTEVAETSDEGDVFKSKVNWYKRFEDGKRVTGPMVLFSSQLYAATFQGAPASSVCGGGTSTVWAMDFLERKTPSNPADGGAPLWEIGTTLAQERPVLDKNGAETVVFGLTLAQEASCIDTNLEALGEDPFIAFGTHTQLRGLNPGKFKLIMHTGGLNNSDITADAANNTQEFELESPSSVTRIDSWAAIVE
jgi:type IV pilus assembly protein PilY1